MTQIKTKIPAELEPAAVGGMVTDSKYVKDRVKNKTQEEVNADTEERVSTLEESVGTGGSVDERIATAKSEVIGDAGTDYNTLGKLEDKLQEEVANRASQNYTKSETYSKTELNNMITTPSQKYVTVTATDQTTAATDVLPATGEADTVYRVGNWDGSQYDTTCYTEYAWNGSAYVKLNTKEVGIDDEPVAGSENLVKSGGVKNALTIHLSYIFYQAGTPTATGQYYIHNGELRCCTYFYTTVNFGYTVIPFNPDTLYEYKGFYFKWNGTSLVMLETSFSENLRTVEEIDGVKDANALDISDLVSSIKTILNTDGTISTGSNELQVATLYHIPVNHGMRLRCRVYGTKVIGYKSINDASPVVLFNAGSSSPSTITTYDIRIPKEITYIRIGVDSGGGSHIYLIEDDLYLQEIIDVDIAYPLDSGYYTFSTAISTLALSYALKGRKIKFRIDENHWEEYTYMLDSAVSGDWTNILNWRKTNSEEYSNKGYIASVNVSKSIVIDNRGYNTQLGQPLIDIVNKEYQPDTDFYLERVMKFVGNSDNIYYWLSLKKILYIRTLRGGFNLYYRGTRVDYNFGTSFVFDNLYHHLMIVKYHEDVTEDEETVRKHYLAMYIDGVKFGNSIDVSSYTGLDNEEKSTFINASKNLGMLLYRVGLPSLVEEDIEGIVARHYNDGNPIAYVCKEENTIAEILGYNMHSSYLTNNISGLSLEVSDVDIVTESPYDNLLKGEGVPNSSPKYVNQEYQDTLTNNRYIAKGSTLPSDWHQEATMTDVNALKTQTKTVNGQSIWGSGDIEGGGSGGSSSVISVIDNGAVGDGITDDTAAIMQALEKARVQGKALFFPNGTYLTKKGLVLTSGMKITGEPNAILRNGTKKAAGDVDFFTRTTAQAAAGATTVTVSDASGFEVGQEIVIWNSGSYTETMADITAINGNTLTIDTSRFTADGTNGGIKNAIPSNGYVLSDFAMIKTIQTKAAENIVVENITIDAKSDMAEPHIYTSSPISQTRQEQNVAQRNFRVYNVTVLASANDGISIQGSGESEVIGCRVYNQKHKGIHWGTNHDMARIMNNYVYGCGSAQYENSLDYQGSGGMFFCSYCHRTIITGNHIENCYKGIFGFNYQSNGECDSNTIIANNTFKNCTLYGVILRDGIHAVLEANNFLGFGGISIPIYVDNPDGQHLRNAVIANNTIGEWNVATQIEGAYMPAIKIEGADGIVINGNVISVKKLASSSPTVDVSRCNIVVVGSNNVVITSNITEGNIDTSDSGNTGIVKANNIEAS